MSGPGWRIVGIVTDGNGFRAFAAYRDPSERRTFREPGPDYRLSDRGRTVEEAVAVLLRGCMLDSKWPMLMNEVQV